MIIPDDMIEACGKVFSGEYDIVYDKSSDLRILDIGANVGAFAVWAGYRWPNAKIFCYEPIKVNYELLLANVAEKKNVECFNVAVGEKEETGRQMYYGTENRGQCSFYKTPEQREYGEPVTVMAAADLPVADIVKLDVEGAEVEIIANMSYQPDVFLLEYHMPRRRSIIENILSDYTLYESKMENIHRGSLKFVKTKTLRASVRPEVLKSIEF